MIKIYLTKVYNNFTVILKPLSCQPEPVEGGLLRKKGYYIIYTAFDRLRLTAFIYKQVYFI